MLYNAIASSLWLHTLNLREVAAKFLLLLNTDPSNWVFLLLLQKMFTTTYHCPF